MDLLESLKKNKIKEAVEALQSKANGNVIKNAAEYNNERNQRDGQVGKREDKTLIDGKVDIVAKMPIPFQRKVVQSSVSFLFGSRVKLSKKTNEKDKGNDAFDVIKDLWGDLRIDSLLLKFCEAVKSETEGTIIFFPVEIKGESKKVKIKARILNSENGKVYPYFDAFGDMIAFGWEYDVKENKKDVSYMHVWTDETNFIFRKEKDWELAEEKGKTPNLFKKIPVVYLSQKHAEWWEVQEMIDRFEMSVSKLADTNDEHSDPKYVLKGKAGILPNKDTKAITIEIIETAAGNIISGDVGLLEWNSAPESKKLELETLKSLINELSSTVDFSKLSEGGFGQLSGIAMKLMFLGPILKAKWSEGDYQIVISRIISLLKASLVNITKGITGNLEELKIISTFTSILPENLKETIEVLSEALGGKQLVSQRTALKHNPMIDSVKEEMSEIEAENIRESNTVLGETVQE